LNSTSRAESARSREHYPKSRSEALQQRSISVVLAEHIDGNLRNKKLGHLFNNISLLAEFQVSIERAASVLDGIAALNYDRKRILETAKNSLVMLPDATPLSAHRRAEKAFEAGNASPMERTERLRI
jgi:hypothetical protein